MSTLNRNPIAKRLFRTILYLGVMITIMVLIFGSGIRRYYRYATANFENDLNDDDAQEGGVVRFPNLSAFNLEGERVDMPQDFAGDYTLVLIAYEQWQQYTVNTWLPALNDLVETWAGRFEYYELPTVGDFSVAQRVYLDTVMVMGIPDETQRRRTITLYVDQDAFNRKLGLPNMDTIYVLLLDQNGVVRWQATGPYTDDLGNDLRAWLEAAMQNESPA